MLTKDQKEWLNHLSDSNFIKITPFDPKIIEIFKSERDTLKSFLGSSQEVLLRGSSYLEIQGKGELDIYIPVSPKDFNPTMEKLINHLGMPESAYPGERMRWNKREDGETVIEIFLIDKTIDDWKNMVLFEEYLLTHPECLEEYISLKQSSPGLTSRAYYTKKLEFMNKIIEVAKK
ncbi:MAG: hypothetical protein US28_C0021G0011 [Candidatus Daviesbacteria bacterium GW2011_GWA1_36_8]|nr:MAG: hypothetical protein US28_C0021G0011 [Candidatus Daviesbacteria bacterium GW2011_GWA1_36_8]